MSNSRPSWTYIGKKSALHAVSTGLGAGIGAAIRGGDVKKSSSVVAIGSGLFSASMYMAMKFGFFGAIPEMERPPLSDSIHISAPAFMEFIGTSIGYFGSKLFINAAVSTEPFVDAAIGFPITVGLLFCSELLLAYSKQNQNVQNANFKPHAL